VGLTNRKLKVGFFSHEKDGSVYGINWAHRDKLRKTFQRVVTRSGNIFLKWLLNRCKDGTGRDCRNWVLLCTLGKE
jgi:hypothetical protein